LLLKIFNFLDAKILAVYQWLTNLYAKITGHDQAHIRLAKIARYTDTIISMVSWNLNQALLFKWGAVKQPYEVSVWKPLIFLLFIIAFWLSANRAISLSESLKTRTWSLAINPLAQFARRHKLVVFLGSLLVCLYMFAVEANHGIAKLAILKSMFLYFWLMTSPHYFLSCLAPPAQKSLFAKLKETLAPEPTSQPVAVTASYRATTA